MAIYLHYDPQGRYVVRADDKVPAPTPPPPPISEPTSDYPIVVIDNGDGAQAMVLKCQNLNGDAFSCARLLLEREKITDEQTALAVRDQLAEIVITSLASGGSGAQLIDLKWPFQNELSLNEFAKTISSKTQSPVIVEIPGLIKVRGG